MRKLNIDDAIWIPGIFVFILWAGCKVEGPEPIPSDTPKVCSGVTYSDNFGNFELVPGIGDNIGSEHEWHVYSTGVGYWRTAAWDACGRWHHRLENVGNDKSHDIVLLRYKRRHDNPSDIYTGGEIWNSNASGQYIEYSYGRFEARIKVTQGPGIINSFFLYKNVSPDSLVEENKEIDIEVMGDVPNWVLFSCWTGRDSTQNSHVWFNSNTIGIRNLAEEFHRYAIDWSPSAVRFYIDTAYTGVSIASNVPQQALALSLGLWVCDQCSDTTLPPNNCLWDQAENNACRNCPGFPAVGSANSGTMEVDYVCIQSHASPAPSATAWQARRRSR